MEEKKAVWFVSTYAGLSLRIAPERQLFDKAGAYIKSLPPVTVEFGSRLRPRRLRKDVNTSPYWGVFKTDDKEKIECLRQHPYYLKTHQSNALNQERPHLLELDFDPDHVEKADGDLVHAGAVSSRPEAPEAPVEGEAEKPIARVGLKKKK